MKTSSDPRHKARMRLIEDLYARSINPQTEKADHSIYKFNEELYNNILSNIDQNIEIINKAICEFSKRDLTEIKSIELVIMQISLAESFISEITPYKVSIDEAIELAKDYGDETSALFVSGVLGAVFSSKYSNNK